MTRDKKRDLKEALADRDYWQSLAPEGWVVGGFTYRNSVIYHKIENDIYTASASFDFGQVAFLKDLHNERKEND